jgi:hypothetical protein
MRARRPLSAAWNAEAAFSFTDDFEIVCKYEGTDEWAGMPERQYGVAGAYGLTEGAAVAVEFLHGEFDDGSEDRNVATVQLALEL